MLKNDIENNECRQSKSNAYSSKDGTEIESDVDEHCISIHHDKNQQALLPAPVSASLIESPNGQSNFLTIPKLNKKHLPFKEISPFLQPANKLHHYQPHKHHQQTGFAEPIQTLEKPKTKLHLNSYLHSYSNSLHRPNSSKQYQNLKKNTVGGFGRLSTIRGLLSSSSSKIPIIQRISMYVCFIENFIILFMPPINPATFPSIN
jgi:hypothetical protein